MATFIFEQTSTMWILWMHDKSPYGCWTEFDPNGKQILKYCTSHNEMKECIGKTDRYNRDDTYAKKRCYKPFSPNNPRKILKEIWDDFGDIPPEVRKVVGKKCSRKKVDRLIKSFMAAKRILGE